MSIWVVCLDNLEFKFCLGGSYFKFFSIPLIQNRTGFWISDFYCVFVTVVSLYEILSDWQSLAIHGFPVTEVPEPDDNPFANDGLRKPDPTVINVL